METLGEIRKELGMTQKRFADRLGICERTYRRYESGERDVPEEVYERICQLLKTGHKNSQPKEWQKKLCAFRVKTIQHKDGGTSQWFISCLAEKCMSYQNGICKREK